MTRPPRRRLALVLCAVALAACYVTRVSDENRVTEYAASQMDCDPSLIHLESESASDDKVARYSAHGCGQTKIFDCTQEGENVVCRAMRPPGTTTTERENDRAGSVIAGVIVGSACACARAASGSHSSSAPPAPKNNPTVNPQDPVRSQ